MSVVVQNQTRTPTLPVGKKRQQQQQLKHAFVWDNRGRRTAAAACDSEGADSIESVALSSNSCCGCQIRVVVVESALPSGVDMFTLGSRHFGWVWLDSRHWRYVRGIGVGFEALALDSRCWHWIRDVGLGSRCSCWVPSIAGFV